jgi:hypothetical protein
MFNSAELCMKAALCDTVTELFFSIDISYMKDIPSHIVL